MELKSLYLNKATYGPNKGTLEGTLSVTTNLGEIKLVLDREKCERILSIVAEQLVESAKEVAQNITTEIIEHDSTKQLESNNG